MSITTTTSHTPARAAAPEAAPRPIPYYIGATAALLWNRKLGFESLSRSFSRLRIDPGIFPGRRWVVTVWSADE